MSTSFRVGIGYDSHRLVPDRPLILGGVQIPFGKGLAGHSDGDVLVHAIIDALRGAAGLPDIGEAYPDSDPRFKDAQGHALLTDTMEQVIAAGFVTGNIDCIIHAEQPKLTPYKQKIADAIAAACGIESSAASVKAKTGEGTGPVGTGEIMAAHAVVLLVRS